MITHLREEHPVGDEKWGPRCQVEVKGHLGDLFLSPPGLSLESAL